MRALPCTRRREHESTSVPRLLPSCLFADTNLGKSIQAALGVNCKKVTREANILKREADNP